MVWKFNLPHPLQTKSSRLLHQSHPGSIFVIIMRVELSWGQATVSTYLCLYCMDQGGCGNSSLCMYHNLILHRSLRIKNFLIEKMSRDVIFGLVSFCVGVKLHLKNKNVCTVFHPPVRSTPTKRYGGGSLRLVHFPLLLLSTIN